MTKVERIGAVIGGWAGAVLGLLLVLAIDSSYEAQELTGGHRLRDASILTLALVAAGGGAAVGWHLTRLLTRSR